MRDKPYEFMNSRLYVDDLGVLRRQINPRHDIFKKGAVAGSVREDGYLQVGVAGKLYYAHRIVWLLTHGCWPVEEIDHINGDRQDNRPINLREASRRSNAQNRTMHREGKLPGTRSRRKRWQARIRIDGKTRYLGTYDTEIEAHAAYKRVCNMNGG